MQRQIIQAVENVIKAAYVLKTDESVGFMEKAAFVIAEAFRLEKKIIIAGNGGSLCDAMHFAEEFTAFFRKKRKALPAIVLSEVGHLTSVSNDEGFDDVFARGIEAFGKEGDVFIALSTSGNSENLIRALQKAKKQKLKTIAFLGKTGGKMFSLADLEWVVKGFETSDRIQEAHMAAAHIIIEIVEKHLFTEEDLSLHKKAQQEMLLNLAK